MFMTTISFGASAQDKKEKKKNSEDGFKFETVKEIKVTSVKDQYRAGICWSFAATAFIEAELLRMEKGEYDLSDAFIVRKSYEKKVEKYVRMHGNTNFGSGGAFHDAFYVIDNFGIMPEENYKGLEYGETNHVHGELDAVLKAYVETVIKNKNKKISTAWFNGLNGILDAYLGENPEKFNVNGKEYTPKTFASELGINSDDYVSIASYTHHPFYESFILEIPDNWMWKESYNVPMNEMMEIIDNSINNGYTVAWGADVSEKSFKWSMGVAIVPEEDRPDLDGLERAKWEEMSAREREKLLYEFKKPVAEKEITQEMRQIAFDNYQTTDDHAMLITGIAKDQNGKKYYIVKNSWNTTNPYKGYFYASENFVEYKTVNYVVHKNTIPQHIKDKLGIK